MPNLVNPYALNVIPSSPPVPGYFAWYTAKDVLNNGSTPANNTPLSVWKDKSGNGNDASQATGANQPLYKTNWFSSNPGVFYDGIDDVLNLSSEQLLGTQMTAIAYFKAATATTDTMVIGSLSNSGGRFQIIRYEGNIGNVTTWNNINPPALRASITASTSPWMVILRQTGSLGDFRINGSVPSTSGSIEFRDYSFRSLGGAIGGVMNGSLAEVIIYKFRLTDQQCIDTETYLTINWS